MNSRILKLRVRLLGFFIILLATNFLTVSCNLLTDTIDAEVEEPSRDNVNDPGSPNSTLAGIENITINGVSFQLGDIPELNSSSLNLAWDVASNSGISDDLRFRLKLASPGQDLTNIEYTDYFTETNYSFNNLVLDETINNDQYSFEIEVSSEVYADKTPIEIGPGTFQVNNIATSAFVILPNQIQSSGDGTYLANIFLDEISSANDLTAYKLDLIFDSNELSITENDITVFTNEQSFLFRNSSSILAFTEVIGDTVRIESGVVGSSLSPLSGGGIVAQLRFQFLNQSTSTASTIRISPTSIFKDVDGADIDLTEFDSSELIKAIN